ncbi:hypothetical protein JGH11_17665 [Dysgonomonas sp. Marseille-P4677]|uniref:hypothetical protein n=1 Tax=Dysgonomonas sp. Marseille-P4677 TaxID=2364790 RepID=UPI001912C728|nr:hypothetical protein [Dysgonomonas sp. Marseille-P4677]MBK5722703.1 hypothetical protein [Dysgonomonas sp. Marseille-P4677]
MKNREKYIEENREIFDDKEPLAGHFERFEALLSKNEMQKDKPVIKKVRLFSVISIAASIIILIGVAVKFYGPERITVAPTTEEAIGIDEFRSMNEFYNQQMEERIADIMCKLAYTDTENQKQLSEDIQKIVVNNVAFVDEMAKNENQEIAIRYLVRHYKANIERLDNINEKLGKYTKC